MTDREFQSPTPDQPDTTPETPQEVTQVTKQVVRELYREPLIRHRREDLIQRTLPIAGAVLGMAALQLLDSRRRAGVGGLLRGLTSPSASRETLGVRLELSADRLERLGKQLSTMEGNSARRGVPWSVLALGAGVYLWRQPEAWERVKSFAGLSQTGQDAGASTPPSSSPSSGIPDDTGT